MSVQEQLTRRIAGEIVVSESPGETMRKWREIFHLSQKEFANLLYVSKSIFLYLILVNIN